MLDAKRRGSRSSSSVTGTRKLSVSESIRSTLFRKAVLYHRVYALLF